jgi:hypothetical protein
MGQAGLVSAAIITASASILVAVLVFILNLRAQVHQERRQARLARVSSQLRELYGPLNALVDVNERIWEALRESHLPPQADRRPEAGTEDWRRWRDHALMPANRRMRDLIIERADLLVETDVPQPLRDFCAHVTSLEIVQAAEEKALKERVLIGHPGAAYVAYVRGAFASLKNEQQHLLRTIDHSPHPAPEARALLS